MHNKFLVWFLITIIFAMFFGYLKNSKADDFVNDYSNDFEERMSIEYDRRPSAPTGFDIDESPVLKYQRTVQAMEDRKAIKKLNRQIKYTYRPYSPDKKQRRKQLGIEDD